MNTPYRTKANVDKISKEMAETILRQADAYFDDARSSINSIGGRATALAGLYTAGAAAAVAALWERSDELTELAQPIVWMLVAFTILWVAAAVLCALILRPRPTPAKGNEPQGWLNVPQLVEGDITVALVGEAERYQDRISALLSRVRADSKYLRIAIWLGIFAPIAMVLVGISHALLTGPDLAQTEHTEVAPVSVEVDRVQLVEAALVSVDLVA